MADIPMESTKQIPFLDSYKIPREARRIG